MLQRSMSLRALLAVVLAGTAAGCCPGLRKQPLTHDGRNRVYYVHEPDNLPGTPLPLVVVLHGATNDGCDAARMTGMNEKSDEEGFLVVYPDGTGGALDRTWNAALCCDPALSSVVDDVQFIEAVIRDLRTTLQYNIDPRRVYVAGFSNGAMLAHAVACRSAVPVAAIAIVAGTGSLDVAHCAPSRAVSVIAFHGDNDHRVEYGGGRFSPEYGGQTYPGIRSVVEFWRVFDQCGTSLPPYSIGTSVEVTRHLGGTDSTEVALYTIRGGNHSWPGGQRVSLFGQTPTQGISATDVIWDFFEQHPRP